MSGWIKIHRSIQEHWLYKEKRSYSKYEAWTDILLTVNFTEAKTIIKGKVYEIRRGESILSLETWSVRWGWDKSKVRRFLNLLQKDHMIVVESDNITTRLKVCKYDDYQDKRHASETQTTFKRNANDIQTTPIEEEEERKEVNRFTPPTIEQVKQYCVERKNKVDANRFIDFYESKGWLVGKSKMKDWKASVRTWEKDSIESPKDQKKTIEQIQYEHIQKQLGNR